MAEVKVGDRVVQRGWKWNNNERNRFGEVVECYSGTPSAGAPGLPMVAVRWDDTGLVERGYLNGIGGTLQAYSVFMATRGGSTNAET